MNANPLTAHPSRWLFKPSLPIVLAVMTGLTATIWLGFWQLRRGHEREAMDAQYANAAAVVPVALAVDLAVPPGVEAREARGRGLYVDRQLLLDNQVNGRTPGYQVLTPLRLAGGGLALINRGWVPQNPDRRVLPTLPLPSGEIEVSGLWRALPQPALALATDNCATVGKDAGWPRIVEYPTAKDLACIYGEPVASGMLLLAPTAPDGFVREWTQNVALFPPSRNYAYALQWFAFAATLLAIFIKLNLKRRP